MVPLLALALHALPAQPSRGSIDVVVKGFVYTIDEPVQSGQDKHIECVWKTSGNSEKVQVQISVDGQPIPTTPRSTVSATGDVSASATWKATPGSHLVTCVADPNGTVAELNETNNKAEKWIEVKDQSGARGGPGAAPMAAPKGGLILPTSKFKICKSVVYGEVTIDLSQFSPQEGIPKLPNVKPKVRFDLVQSSAVADYVHCEYVNTGKDVKVAYTYDCVAAAPTAKPHTFGCQ
jgi:hypothetical protein